MTQPIERGTSSRATWQDWPARPTKVGTALARLADLARPVSGSLTATTSAARFAQVVEGVVMADRRHLHLDDYPTTLQLLADLFAGKNRADLAAIGYEPTEHGAYLDWDALGDSWLSSTERAVVRIAHGCSTLEWAGGPRPDLCASLRRAMDTVARERPQI